MRWFKCEYVFKTQLNSEVIKTIFLIVKTIILIIKDLIFIVKDLTLRPYF